MRLQSWSAEQLELPAHSTLRCLLGLPDGRLAAGSDYGMVLHADGRFAPFPFPIGARREMRAVTDLAVHDGTLVAATERGQFLWPFQGEAVGKGFPRDGRGGFDDLRALWSSPKGLLRAWRTHLEGGEGPPEGMSFCTAWQDRVFMGTRDGRLHEVDVGPIRRFVLRDKPRPVRHMAYAAGYVWVAAAETLWRWDGARWESQGPEPYALTVDRWDRLWTLAQGRLHTSRYGEWPQPLDLTLTRPWMLHAQDHHLWIGSRGGLSRAQLSPP